jgi:hypothetical protein
MNQTPILNDQGLYEIYELWHTPWWQTRTFYLGAGFVFMAVFTYAILRLIKRYHGAARHKNPWEIALLELQALRQSNIDTVEASRECYERLCWILKKYISARFGMHLEGKTEQEMITILEMSAVMPQYQINELQEVFQGGTLVKFAKLSVLREQVIHDLERSTRIVLATRPHDNV